LNNLVASVNLETQDVNDQVEIMFELEDPDLLIDFCKINEDDKHRCKVGKPGRPVAAVERGQ
ncbi:13641_t:CDS:2, partial [Funneliformis geosporum]